MKRARTSANSTAGNSTDKNDVQVNTTAEEIICSIANFSSIFPNIFLEGVNHHLTTPEDKFNLIKDKVWGSKKPFTIRSMMMVAETGNQHQDDQAIMVGTVSMKASLLMNMDGGIYLGGLLAINLDSDQIKVYNVRGVEALSRAVSLKATVIDKSGKILYGAVGMAEPQMPFYDTCDKRLQAIFYLAPLKTLWENHEFYFPNDLLRVKISVDSRNDAAAAADELTFLPQGYKCLSDDLLGMFRSGEGADFEIVCKSMKFPVHKAILACRSTVFCRVLATDKGKRAKSGTVNDIEPRIMKMLLEYIYSSKIELHSLDSDSVLAIGVSADKYEILKLRDLCFSFAADRIHLKTAGQLAVILYKHSAKEEIRSQVFDYCASNWKELCSQEKFQVLVETCPSAFINKKT